MNLALIIDVGTSNIKVGLVSAEGAIIEHAADEIEAVRPEHGAYEHDPDILLRLIGELSRKVVRSYADSISVVGFSGYQFGFLPLGENGDALTGMITLLDGRSRQVMDHLQDELPTEEIYSRTGCPPLFNYTLPKVRWLQEYKPDIFARTRRIADLKSFLLENFTGHFVTEPSIASATQLLNIHTFDWDDKILRYAGIDRSYLPKVVPGEEILGTLTSGGGEMLGVSPRIPVFPGFYDGAAMVLGMGGHSNDVVACNLGTTAMLRGCARSPLLDDPAAMRLQTYALMENQWIVGGAINNAGIGLNWYRDTFTPGQSYDEITLHAETVNAGSDGLFCLPFLTGERDPRIGNKASGSYIGLKEFHHGAHMSRSILEGVAYTLRMLRDACVENQFRPPRIRIGGSGAKSDLWVQILADVLRMPIERTTTSDPALIGAGMVAFSALGTYESLDEAAATMVKVGNEFHPSDSAVSVYDKGYTFFLEMVNIMKEVYPVHARNYL